MARTLIIAEAGSCHDGSLEKAYALIAAAHDVGADIVKFQFWSSADRMAERRRTSKHLRDVYARYQVPKAWLPALWDECNRAGIEFMCSTYLPEDVATVAPLVTLFKIASFEAEDSALIRAHEPFLAGKELLVSLGMNASPNFATLLPYSLTSKVRQLHCVSAYPAPVEALNLRTLWADGEGDRAFAGFSDHSDPALTWTGALAVAAGAEIIEAHLRLEETDQGNPDAPHAMTPRQFDSYVRHIRFAEACLGAGDRQLQPCELEMAQFRVRSSS
jgi:N,N'-diacetyllegionaminate synthase